MFQKYVGQILDSNLMKDAKASGRLIPRLCHCLTIRSISWLIFSEKGIEGPYKDTTVKSVEQSLAILWIGEDQ